VLEVRKRKEERERGGCGEGELKVMSLVLSVLMVSSGEEEEVTGCERRGGRREVEMRWFWCSSTLSRRRRFVVVITAVSRQWREKREEEVVRPRLVWTAFSGFGDSWWLRERKARWWRRCWFPATVENRGLVLGLVWCFGGLLFGSVRRKNGGVSEGER
ncbi:hypothetical protein HAX54_052555, partial [Datura stramonium]|nr:hypothetical protein [Datura stramonium]